MSAFQAIRDFVVDEFFVVSVPKRLVIRNHKLGILLRVSQLVLFVGLAIGCLANQVWQRSLSPAPWITEFWLEEPADEEGHKRLHNSNVQHCNNPKSYWESGTASVGPGRNAFRPHGCEALASFEASWRDNGRLFVPTLVQETEIFGGELCGNNSTSIMELPPGASVTEHCMDTHVSKVQSCSCTVDRTFFTQNPEQQRIVLRHGYSVDLSQGRGEAVMQQSIMSPIRRTYVSGEPVQEEQAELVTIILATDGSPCKVGGRSEWLQSEARWGITGTLGEWLVCAGVNLDAAPEPLLPGSSGLARHFRTMGLVIQIRLDYHNTAGADTCFLSLQAQVQWTTVPTVHDRLFLPQQARGLHRAERVRTQYGVMLTTTVIGQYTAFDFSKLTTAAVELIVLFEVPPMMMRFLALYCLGFLSEVYRRARVTQFSIYSHFHGAIARMMLAEIGFRGLLGGTWKGKVANTELLTLQQVTNHVQDLFQEQMKFRILKIEDVDRIAVVAFNHMRKTSSDAGPGARSGVSCHDYVRSCTADDTMDVSLMTKVLAKGTNNVSSFIGGLFDTNRRKLRASMQSSLEQSSLEFDVPTDADHVSSTLGSSRSNSSKGSQNSFSDVDSWKNIVQELPQQEQQCQQQEQPKQQPLQPHHPQLAKLEESLTDVAAAGETHGTALEAGTFQEEKDRVDDGSICLSKLEFKQIVRDLLGHTDCVRQDSDAVVASLRKDVEAKHGNLREEVKKLFWVVNEALEFSSARILDLEERLNRLDSPKKDCSLIDAALFDEAGIKVVNVNATAVVADAATGKQSDKDGSENDGVNTLAKKVPRVCRRLSEGFLSPRHSCSKSPRSDKGQMSPRGDPQRRISAGNSFAAGHSATNAPKMQGCCTAAAAVATEPMAQCPSWTQEARSAVPILETVPPKERPPAAVPAEGVRATLLQKQLAVTPRTTDQEILAMSLSDLVQISTDPMATAEPGMTAAQAPKQESRGLLESQFRKATRAMAGFQNSSGKEDVPRDDQQKHMSAGPSLVVPKLSHSGIGQRPLPPPRPPSQVLATLEDEREPYIGDPSLADGMAGV